MVSLNEITLIINDFGNGFENVNAFLDNVLLSVRFISRSQNKEQNVLKQALDIFPAVSCLGVKKKNGGTLYNPKVPIGKITHYMQYSNWKKKFANLPR